MYLGQAVSRVLGVAWGLLGPFEGEMTRERSFVEICCEAVSSFLGLAWSSQVSSSFLGFFEVQVTGERSFFKISWFC